VIDLGAETHDIDRLLEAATAMLGELEVFLRARQAGISGLRIRFRHLGQAATRIRLRLVRPSRQARHMRELLASRLERLRLAAPVIGLDLDSSRIEPLSNQNASLLRSGPAGSEGPSLQLVERLRARLGEEAVHALCLLSEHRPESAWRVAEPGQPSERLVMPPRPFWLLEEPVRLADRSGVPLARGRLVPESGPERIETGWWDGHDVAREYYVARDAAGVRLWIYRDTRGDRAWYLHGIFG
jgi:protein ImuB